MAVERYGSKTDVVVKLVLVFFISLLSFSIGTFVGKKFSDNQHKISQLEPHGNTDPSAAEETSQAERGVASISPDVVDVKPGQTLSDDEIAKLAEEFISDEETNEAPANHNEKAADHNQAQSGHSEAGRNPASTDKKDETTSHAATAHSPSAAAKKVAEGNAPAIEKTEPTSATSQIPSALPKEVAASAAGKFTVQVAAYPKEDEAKSMASDLKGKGFSAFYVEANVKGQTWYRVNVGLFTTQKEAQSYKDDLLARAKVGSAIVQKIVK